VAHRDILHRNPRNRDTPFLDGGAQERILNDIDVYETGRWPAATAPSSMEVGPDSARVSMWDILGLIISVVALCATLTGLLAAEGAAIGVLGFLISIAGLVGSGRPGVNGRAASALAALIAVVAVVLAAVAISGRYSWLTSDTNEVARWHAWLTGHRFG
jgi:hypothetical protein